MKSSVIGFALGALVLAGCSSSSRDDTAAEQTTTIVVTADVVLDRASEAMADVDTASFTIEHEGPDVFIDDDETIRFDGATGRYSAPGSADALVAVTALGLSTEIGAVAIDSQIWITSPLTGRWEEAPEALTFNPAQIFDETVGLSGLLADGFNDTELVSIDPDADGRYEVSGSVDPQRVSDLTGGLIDDVSNATVWVDAETGQVAELSFDVDIEGAASSWRLYLDDYGSDVTITQPELG